MPVLLQGIVKSVWFGFFLQALQHEALGLSPVGIL